MINVRLMEWWSGGMTKRLFIGLSINNKDICRIEQWRIANGIETLHNIPRENYHITLAFLGHVSNEAYRLLSERIKNLTMPRVELTLDQLEYWSKPKILCLTASHVPTELQQLVAKLWEILEPLGYRNQYAAYSPHITLCRKAPHLTQPNIQDSFTLSFEHFSLFESRSTAIGVRYIPFKTG